MTHGQQEVLKYLMQFQNEQSTTVLPAPHRDSIGSLVRNGWVLQQESGGFTVWTITDAGRGAFKLHHAERLKRMKATSSAARALP